MKKINWLKGLLFERWQFLWMKTKNYFIELWGCLKAHQAFFIKSLVLFGSAFVLFLILQGISSYTEDHVLDQKSNLAWGGKKYAQVSCYTSRRDGFTSEEIMRFEYEVENSLKKSNVKNAKDKKNEDKEQKWTDAYSGAGEITVMNGNSSVEGTVYGVGNDFFTFHPLTLLSGGYIDTDAVMKDYILIDEEAAWQLFGSSEVEGMSVTINGEKYVVSGVFRRPDNRINNSSGNGTITFYMNFDALAVLDEQAVITNYEMIMVNPVEHYAYDYIYKYFLQVDEQGNETAKRDIQVIENSDRYSLINKWNYLRNTGINMMDLNEIDYPYWENAARAYGSILNIYFAGQLFMILVMSMILIVNILHLHRQMKKIREKRALAGQDEIFQDVQGEKDERQTNEPEKSKKQGLYKIVTLCGSTRFKNEFMEVQKQLTLEGNIVLSVGCFDYSGDDEVWTGGKKEMLDNIHRKKIDMADEIFVINVGGYIGESTKKEIEYAKSKQIPVLYYEPVTA